MTDEEFETLRSWGETLTEDARSEVRAAGRAIMLLAEEVERLQVQLWHARLGIESLPAATPAEAGAPGAEEEPAAEGNGLAGDAAEPQLEPALGRRLRSVLRLPTRRGDRQETPSSAEED